MKSVILKRIRLKSSLKHYRTTQRDPLETVTVTPLDIVTGPNDIALSVAGIVKLVPIVLLLVTIPLLARWIGADWVVPSKVRSVDWLGVVVP